MACSWSDLAWDAINAAHGRLPSDASLAQRIAAIDAAYPFGQREYHPYKIWLKARRSYLGKYGWRGGRRKAEPTPIERLCEAP